ncbi:MAG: hypothetical protein K2H22_05490, partial [Muribaculaceae bacterium]|nr:hypothetical protein [Muribaculaceae bacterium]
EYDELEDKIRMTEMSETVLDCIVALREKIRSKADAIDPETGEVPEENARYYISDRRWRKCVSILKTSACLNGRRSIDYSDILLFSHMLWNEDSSIDEIRQITAEAVVESVYKNILDKFKSPKRHALRVKDKNGEFMSPDGTSYLIDCDGSPLKIRKRDYNMLKKDPKGIFFGSETTDGTLLLSDGGQFTIRYEENGVLNINGFSYHLKTETDKELDRGFISETENIFDSYVNSLIRDIEQNVFTSRTKVFHTVQAIIAIYRKRFIQLKGR